MVRRIFSRLILPGLLSEPSQPPVQDRKHGPTDLFGSVAALSAWLENQPSPVREHSTSARELRRWLGLIANHIWQMTRELEGFSLNAKDPMRARLSGMPAEAELTALQTRAAALRERAMQLHQGAIAALEQMSLTPSPTYLVALEGQVQSQLSALGAIVGVFISDWATWQQTAIETLANNATPVPARWRALGCLATLGRAALILALGAPLLLIPSLGIRLYGILAFVVLLYTGIVSFQGRWAACPICGELAGPFPSEGKMKTCDRCRQPLILQDNRVYSIRGLTQEEDVSGESIPSQ